MAVIPAHIEHAGPARRMAQIRPFQVMEVMERALRMGAAGQRVIHMEIGQPDFGAPPLVIAAATKAMHASPLGYTSTLGIHELRSAIAEDYRLRYGTHISSARIVITPGASGALLLAMGTLVNPEDEVLLVDPGYSCNANFVRMFGATAKLVTVDEGTRYQPTLGDIQSAWSARTRGLLIASPANPTGTMIPAPELRAISEWAQKQGGFVIVDEIYQGLIYDSTSYTSIDFSPQTWVINSFSKYVGMTGWRLG